MLQTPSTASTPLVPYAFPIAAAHALLARWTLLQPRAHAHPADVRALVDEIAVRITDCELGMIAIQARVPDAASMIEMDRLLEAAHVLDRLHWCALHTAPYVARPRSNFGA